MILIGLSFFRSSFMLFTVILMKKPHSLVNSSELYAASKYIDQLLYQEIPLFLANRDHLLIQQLLDHEHLLFQHHLSIPEVLSYQLVQWDHAHLEILHQRSQKMLTMANKRLKKTKPTHLVICRRVVRHRKENIIVYIL